jgi:hypothetical protein
MAGFAGAHETPLSTPTSVSITYWNPLPPEIGTGPGWFGGPTSKRPALFPLLTRLSKNAKIPFDELRVSGKILSKWISNRSG